MLVATRRTRAENRWQLRKELRKPAIPVRLTITGGRVVTEWASWRTFWQPAWDFFAVDLRLVQRLNRLKRAWLGVLERALSVERLRTYCWRYFGLLYHALRLACEEPERPDPLPALRRILGFETFTVQHLGQSGAACGLFASRNPIFLLGRLPTEAPLPTPRHVLLALPCDAPYPFYGYRQLHLGKEHAPLLLLPTVELSARPTSFGVIDRMARLLSKQADPYCKSRARMLARRAVLPLMRAWMKCYDMALARRDVSILDLGAGTGHLAAATWRQVTRCLRGTPTPSVALHFVDASEPCFGRSFGLSRDTERINHIEWAKADCRSLLDDDQWLHSQRRIDLVLMCRLLGNTSNMMIEDTEDLAEGMEVKFDACNPCVCLASRRQPDGIHQLQLNTARRTLRGGTTMPQFSLAWYFAAMRAVMAANPQAARPEALPMPIRRFNPAALITATGRSVLGQLLRVSSAVVIEDVDLRAEHLLEHHRQFVLADAMAVQCVGDGFRTQARHFIVARQHPSLALRRERLW